MLPPTFREDAMTHHLIFGECDCCGTRNRVLTTCVAYGSDTAACTECRYGSLSDDADELHNEIERLLPLAETGEQHTRICALEAAYVEAAGRQLR
jgi:hypothetical protein